MIDEIRLVNLGSLIQQRGKSVLEKFNEVIDSGISDPKLLTILHFIKDYSEGIITDQPCYLFAVKPSEEALKLLKMWRLWLH